MGVTFITSDKEYEKLSRGITKGVWVLPPAMTVNDSFVVVHSDGKDVFVKSFKTIDGVMLYAMGCEPGDPSPASGMKNWDIPGALRTETDAMEAKHV